MVSHQLEYALENLSGTGYDKNPISPQTSGPPQGYNCIAFAAGRTDRWWWPYRNRFLYYWPDHLDRYDPGHETEADFIHAFEWLGYKLCKDGKHKKGVEKVAIFLKNKRPTHAARQLPSGMWTSKCGGLEDIQHETLAAVEGNVYGKASIFLHRRVDGKPFLADTIRAFFKQIFVRF